MKTKQKLCLWCNERPVTGLYGPEPWMKHNQPWYDEDMNSCSECLEAAMIKIGKPIGKV